LAATALSSVLLTFAVTIGLGVTSTAPTWRDASAALAILSGLYLIIQAVLSFGLGGYIAGHGRLSASAATPEETEHVDGAHGLGAWALAVVMGAVLATLIGAATINRTAPTRSSAQASAADASRHVGAVDVTPRPTVTPNVSSTDDSAVAANAPSMIGDHCRKRGAVSLRSAVSLRATGEMFSIDISMLAKAEEGQDRQDHDDESNEIDKTVHGFLRVPAPFCQSTICRKWQSSICWQEKDAISPVRL